MLDEPSKTQLAAYLERVTQPFEMVASLDDSETSRDMRALLETIQSLRADKITLRLDGNDARKPSFSLQRAGSDNQLALCRPAAGPRIHLPGAGAAVDRRPPAQGGAGCHRPDQGPESC